MRDIECQVMNILSGCMLDKRRKIEPASRLVEDLYIDSIGVVETVMALNEAFAIDLPDADVAQWRTVADICCSVRLCKAG